MAPQRTLAPRPATRPSWLLLALALAACPGRGVTPAATAAKSAAPAADRAQVSAPAPAPGDPFSPARLAGPFPSLEAYCASIGAKLSTLEEIEAAPPPEHPEDEEYKAPPPACDLTRTGLAAPPPTLSSGPYEEVRFFARVSERSALPPRVSCELALRTAAGWFAAGPTFTCRALVGMMGVASATVTATSADDLLPGGAPELTIRYRVRQEMVTIDEGLGGVKKYGSLVAESEYAILCGIGPSGAPSCTAGIPVVVNAPLAPEEEYPLAYRIWPDGRLEIWAMKQSPEELDALKDVLAEGLLDEILGVHPLVFP
jgi:hypothetical protein